MLFSSSRKASTVVAITGKTATPEGKTASVKVSFKAKKTGKTSKYSYVSKVSVIEDKITMTAAATAVKEITLTFNKAVKDTAAAKITVKKANSAPTFTVKWAEDAKTATLAMDSKLTKGTYDITVSGVEKEDLTASVTVEDQKLTAFEFISTNLVADPVTATSASIYFRAVDQYGKNIAGVNPTVTTSFGGKATAGTTKTTENTKISVTNMSATLCVLGTKGTVTVVDSKTGVNKTVDVVYSAPAKASKVEVVSLYNVNSGKKLESLTAGDKAGNIKLALKFTDQYGAELAVKDVTDSKTINVSLAAGTTGIDLDKAADTVTIDDKEYYAISFKNDLKAGSFQLTIVNSQVGLLDNLKFDVAAGTVIKSFSVSADEDIYAGEQATLSYTAIDAEGKEVTSYDVIDKAFKNDSGVRVLPAGVDIEKQKDGSAKITYKYKNGLSDVENKDKDNLRGSDNTTLTFQVYPNSTNIIVVNTAIRVNQKRVFWEVSGVNSDKAVAGVTGEKLSFKAEDFKISDQYGNTLSKDKINELISATNAIKVADEDSDASWTVTATELKTKADKFTINVGSKNSAKVKVYATAVPAVEVAKNNGYVLTLSQANADKASNFEIKWNNDGLNTFCVSGAALTATSIKNKFTVVGKVGGKTVTIPTDNYAVTGLTGGDCLGNPNGTGNDKAEKKTVEGTVTVNVSTKDDNNKFVTTEISAKFTASNEDAKLASIKKNDDSVAAKSDMTVADLAKCFNLKDQYGNSISSDGVAAKVVILSATSKDADVQYNGSTSCKLVNMSTGDKISVTLTKGDLTDTREIKLS